MNWLINHLPTHHTHIPTHTPIHPSTLPQAKEQNTLQHFILPEAQQCVVMRASSAYIKKKLTVEVQYRWTDVCSVVISFFLPWLLFINHSQRVGEQRMSTEYSYSFVQAIIHSCYHSFISFTALFQISQWRSMQSRHASPFSLQRLNERWRWMEVHDAANRSEWARTNPKTAAGETYTGSSTQFSSPLYSATHPAHLTSERTHFTKGSKVMSSQSGGWCV